MHFILPSLLPLRCFDSPLKLSLLCFGHYATLMLCKQLVWVLIRAVTLRL